MKDLSLVVCTHYMMPGYSVRMFAEMRGYVINEKLKLHNSKKYGDDEAQQNKF